MAILLFIKALAHGVAARALLACRYAAAVANSSLEPSCDHKWLGHRIAHPEEVDGTPMVV